MRSSTSRSKALLAGPRPYRVLAAVVPLLLGSAAIAFAQPSWTSHPRLTLSVGYESDRLPDPILDRFALPGGNLIGLAPGIWITGRPGARTRLDLTGQIGYEKFQNDADRSVLGGLVSSELRVRVAPSWFWRTALAGNYYSDSAYETADRVGGGAETGFGMARRRWSLGMFGGVDGRRYQNLIANDEEGIPGTYTESGFGLGLAGSARLGTSTLLAGRITRLWTDSRDSLYDSHSWLAQGSMRAETLRGLFLTLTALGQRRLYDRRPASQDATSYWQIGVGFERAMTATVGLTARYAFARTTDPSYADENLHRLTLGATWGLGGSAVAADLRLPADSQSAPLRENQTRIFRCHAPSAREVLLVGDFNGWDSTANRLRPEREGWWRAEVRLPAGSHQYAYLVDGKIVTPADAEATVDDGFGGRNGLIWVAPESP